MMRILTPAELAELEIMISEQNGTKPPPRTDRESVRLSLNQFYNREIADHELIICLINALAHIAAYPYSTSQGNINTLKQGYLDLTENGGIAE